MGAESAAAARPSKRKGDSRVRALLWTVHGVTLVAHVVPTLALGTWLPRTSQLTVGAALWLAIALWLGRLGPDRRRSRVRTRLCDEPLFVHWGACILGLGALPVAVAGALTVGGSASEAGLSAYALGALVAAWGVWGSRRRVHVSEVVIRIDGLPAAFEGYRIAHLTDLHIGSFDDLPRGRAWIRLANAQRPDLIAVTGDLVTSGTAFYGDVARVLADASAPDGVLAVLGNHDQWDDRALERAVVARGVTVLRNDRRIVRRGAETLVIAGVDDPYTGKDDLERALAPCEEGLPTILLSHYPHLFEEAARRGARLVLSGHTHGGQFGVPFVADRLNVARLTGQRGRGLYRLGDAQLFVSAGLGTTGPPMRVGVAPEIPVLVLRCGVPSPT